MRHLALIPLTLLLLQGCTSSEPTVIVDTDKTSSPAAVASPTPELKYATTYSVSYDAETYSEAETPRYLKTCAELPGAVHEGPNYRGPVPTDSVRFAGTRAEQRRLEQCLTLQMGGAQTKVIEGNGGLVIPDTSIRID